MAEAAAAWDEAHRAEFEAAQATMRRLVPPDIRTCAKADLGARGLPPALVTRLWTKKATWLVRFHPDDTARLHIADLLSKFNNQGLDVVEMRAVWASLPPDFENDGDGKKRKWRENFRVKLEELVTKEAAGRLGRNEARHPGYRGLAPDASFFDAEAPLVQSATLK